MAKEHKHFMMEKFTKENFKKDRFKDKEFTNTKMEQYMKVNLLMELKMIMGNSRLLIYHLMKVKLKNKTSMGWELWIVKMVKEIN